MRTTILIAVMLLLVSSTSGHAGGPGRNLRPGLTRATQVTALSPGGPREPVPTGAIQTFLSLFACLAAITTTALLRVDSGHEKTLQDPDKAEPKKTAPVPF